MTQALKSLFSNRAEFQVILGKAQGLCAFQQQFLAATPAYLAQGCHVLSLEFGTLTIATSNATVAAKLRQIAPEIVLNLKKMGAEVSGVRVKVQVSYVAAPSLNKLRRLSLPAQSAINQLSESLKDSPLKDALKKMAAKKSV